MNNANLPIVFVHTSESMPQFLLLALVQAKLSNPTQPVILLSDIKQPPQLAEPLLAQGIQYHHIKDYQQEVIEFQKRYFHFSVNPLWYERFCFERWFILREFARQMNYDRLIHFDSDVLIYSDLTESLKPFTDFSYASLWGSWGTILFNDMQVLDTFIDLTMQIYGRSSPLWFTAMQRVGFLSPYNGGPYHGLDNISDMFVTRLIHETRKDLTYADLYKVTNGGVFDRNINLYIPETPHDPEFEGDGKMKKFHWKDGVPYGRLMPSGEEVRFHCLHFQGGAKQIMASTFELNAKLWLGRNGIA